MRFIISRQAVTDLELLGVGSGLLTKVGNTLKLKSLVEGSGITFTGDNNNLIINAIASGTGSSGESNTASNIGLGEGIFANKVGVDLRFKKIYPGSGIKISASGNSLVVDNTIVDDFAILTSDVDDLRLDFINSSGIFVKTASNIGLGQSIFFQKVSQDLQFRRLLQGSGIFITASGNTLRIDNTLEDDIQQINVNFANASGLFYRKDQNLIPTASKKFNLGSEASNFKILHAQSGVFASGIRIGTSSIKITAPAGQNARIDGASVLVDKNLLIRGGSPWFDVKAFGALGDGSTDDAPAIQAAVNAASGNALGGVIYFPPTISGNEYIIGSTILIPRTSAKSFVFLGNGARQSPVKAKATMSATTPMFAFESSMAVSQVAFHIYFADIMFSRLINGPVIQHRQLGDSNRRVELNLYRCGFNLSNTASGRFIDIEGLYYGHFQDVEFRGGGSGTGIWLKNGARGLLDNVRGAVSQPPGPLIHINGGGAYHLQNIRSETAGSYDIKIENTEQISIDTISGEGNATTAFMSINNVNYLDCRNIGIPNMGAGLNGVVVENSRFVSIEGVKPAGAEKAIVIDGACKRTKVRLRTNSVSTAITDGGIDSEIELIDAGTGDIIHPTRWISNLKTLQNQTYDIGTSSNIFRQLFAQSGVFKGSPWFDVRAFASVSAANSAIPASGGTLFFSPGNYTIASNLTILPKTTLKIANGAVLNVASGVTFTIQGRVEECRKSNFVGLGTVTRERSTFPELRDDFTNSSGIFQAGVNKINELKIDFDNASGIWVKNGENLGTGKQIFIQKDSDENLEFRTLIGGSGIEISTSGSILRFDNEIVDDFNKLFNDFHNSSGVFIKNAANVGLGSNVFAQKNGQNLEFRRLLQGSGIKISTSGNTLRIDNTYEDDINKLRDNFDNASGIWVKNAVNLGIGSGLFIQKNNNQILEFKTFIPGSGILIRGSGTHLRLDVTVQPSGGAGGESNTASNVGLGIGVFDSKVGVDLRFKRLLGGSGIEVRASGQTIIFDNELSDDVEEIRTDFTNSSGIFVKNGENLGGGIGLFIQKDAQQNLEFRSLVGGSGLEITTSGNIIRFDNEFVDDHNILRTDFDNASGIWIKTASNVSSSGVGIFKQKIGSDLQFKKLVAGANISFVESPDSIRIIGSAAGGGLDHTEVMKRVSLGI